MCNDIMFPYHRNLIRDAFSTTILFSYKLYKQGVSEHVQWATSLESIEIIKEGGVIILTA